MRFTVCLPSKNNSAFLALFFLVLLLALALRLPHLAQRPMHTDEAVHAIKFAALLEDNDYQYDPLEYHGPTLNYFTLIPAWLSSARNITQINETTLRIVPVFFGLFLIAALLFVADGLGRCIIAIAALLMAISPVMVFYSRYYIQEMLLVFFTFGTIASGYRLYRTKRIFWSIIIGVFLGLMHATKETCIIAWGSMLIACFLTFFSIHKTKLIKSENRSQHGWHALVIIVMTFIVSALFFSSFFSHPRGIIDSLLTYKTYFYRAGRNAWHIHPWYYYFELLLYSKKATGPLWSEAIIVVLALIGLTSVILRKNDGTLFSRFIAFYTISMTIIYSAIPYKTPWTMLSFFHGIILLAAIGAASMWRLCTKKWMRIAYVAVLAIGVGHLGWQSVLANYRYVSDPTNPYVYAHTSKDIFTVVERIENVASVHADGKNMFIEVISPEADYWPLPWYLRSFTNVGWWSEVEFDVPPAPVIVATPSVESDLIKKLYELPPPGEKSLYVPLFDSYTEIRPNVELRGYVRKDLWDKFLQTY